MVSTEFCTYTVGTTVLLCFSNRSHLMGNRKIEWGVYDPNAALREQSATDFGGHLWRALFFRFTRAIALLFSQEFSFIVHVVLFGDFRISCHQMKIVVGCSSVGINFNAVGSHLVE